MIGTMFFALYEDTGDSALRALARSWLADADVEATEEEDTLDRKLARSRWAALIKRVYEVNPLACPKCGQEMRIIAFIEKRDQYDVIEGILKHCGLWREPVSRAPPKFILEPEYIPMDEFLANF